MLILVLLICRLPLHATDREIINTDVCVYGATPGGITAALAAARRGHSVIIVEPHRHVGGMHSSGLRIHGDCHYLKDIGGIARELLDDDCAVPGHHSQSIKESRLMIRQKLDSAGIQYITEHRLDSPEDVVKEGTRIQMIHLNYAPIMDEGVPPPEPTKHKVISINAKVFIDASYEGDLMAFAGCDYTTGRESKARYNESLAGQGKLRTFDVDPYVNPGDPSSGVLPMISTEPYEPGAASRYHLAYNFRLRRGGENAQLLLKPLGKIDHTRYELVKRGLEKYPGRKNIIGWPTANSNRKTMVSGSIPGLQADYPDGDWLVRSRIWRDWIDHIKTMDILCGNQSVFARGEYPDNYDFPDRLYIRMGRRLIGERVMTQHDLMHQTVINDPIGLGYYLVDIYPPRLIAHEGKVASEGEIYSLVSPGPYQISYRALLPKKGQCTNLIVPVCISASHVAMASIRMEGMFAVMGEAAGIAASHAINSNSGFHDIDFDSMRADMKKVGVVTEWNGIGYGKGFWSVRIPRWHTHPEEYNKIPIRLDPSWNGFDPAMDDKIILRPVYPSAEEWACKHPGLEWLFPHIDKNGNGWISEKEYRAFQNYKQKDKNWEVTLKSNKVQKEWRGKKKME